MTSSKTPVSSAADALYDRALRSLPGGNSRSLLFVAPHPPYAARGVGCRITDVDGHVVIDLLNNYTSLLHGHAHPDILAAATEVMELGTAFSLPTEQEIALAELLGERIPSAERWRFTNSGTEAVMMAVRAARAYTGRDLIVRFDGCYHGTYDLVALDSRGISPGTVGDVIVLPAGDSDALVAALERNGQDVAGVLIDSMPARAGMIPATSEFMRVVRQQTEEHGIVMIQDEVITLRVDFGGMQSLYDVKPDITTAAKIIGGGFPVGAVGGRAEVMDVFNPTTDDPVKHGGTFSANPVTLRAGLTAMQMMTESEHDRINGLGDRLRNGLREQGWTVNGLGSLLKLEPGFSEETWWRLYEGGVLVALHGLCCISTPMTEDTIEEALAVFARVAA
jgi:glutamate-1-semialdehyde 2,1-aminomutase